MMMLIELIVFWLDYCALVITDAPPLDLNDFIVHETQLSVVAYKPFPPCKMHQPFVPVHVHQLMCTLASCSSHAHSYLNPCLQRRLAAVPCFLYCEHAYKMALLVLSINAWYRLSFSLSILPICMTHACTDHKDHFEGLFLSFDPWFPYKLHTTSSSERLNCFCWRLLICSVNSHTPTGMPGNLSRTSKLWGNYLVIYNTVIYDLLSI